MIVCDKIFADNEEEKKFVMACEGKYSRQIDSVAKRIAENREVRFVMLCGATCSGKTTTSLILAEKLRKSGRQCKTVSIDDFYYGREKNNHAGKPDYESISAIDLDLFIACTADILAMKPTGLPVFDFELGMRSGFQSYIPQENEIIIFEGIQALYPEILSLLPQKYVQKIYIGITDSVNAYGHTFEEREVRLMRRIVRDYKFRNSSVARTLSLWDSVSKNEDKNIFPNASLSDYRINTFLPYEINVIKPFILKKSMYDFSNKEENELFLAYQKALDNVPVISDVQVPKCSVFREFIG